MKIVWICLWMLCASSAWAEAVPAALEQGLQRLSQLKGFSCEFKQIMTYGDGSQQVFDGTLAVARVGHFRWQYVKPYAQLYISNGQGIWLYEPDLMQVQWLDALDAIDPMAMRLLEGRVKADEVHFLGMDGDTYHIKIGTSERSPELWLSLNQQGLPEWFESRDALNNRNRIELLSIQTAMPNMKIFEFTVPDGVDVIDANGQIMEKQ